MIRLDRILLASDLHTVDVWREAAIIARTFGSEVCLVHAVQHPQGTAAYAEGSKAAFNRQQELLALAQDEGITVSEHPVVRAGEPAEVVLEAAREIGADLIVLGAGARTNLGRILLGSCAERVSREATAPVWLVKPGKPAPHPGFKRLMCAVDASAPAREALATAIFLARTFVARLQLVSVLTHARAEKGQALGTEEVQLRGCMEAFDLHGIDVSFSVREGRPAVEIIEASQETACDLLIMGSAGRKGVARLLRSNTAEKIMRVVPCSLLTTKQAEV